MTDQAEPTIQGLQRQVIELHIEQIKASMKDHETRLRIVEDVAIRFNFMLYLTMGGGLVSLTTLAMVIANMIASNNAP
jgi:imidazole glycerol phosphate synthase subunit HisF